MKAIQDFVLHVRADGAQNRIPFKEGDLTKNVKVINVLKGKEIPQKYLREIILKNPELADLQYSEKRPINIPKDLGIVLPEPSKKPMKILPRKYSQSSLNEIYNKEGFAALKKIGEQFDPPVTDRSSRRIIVEILKAQEEERGK